jgi:hypothetical protein
MTPKPYDTTVAMMAALIYAAWARDSVSPRPETHEVWTRKAIEAARAIVAEVQRTEPEKASDR